MLYCEHCGDGGPADCPVCRAHAGAEPEAAPAAPETLSDALNESRPDQTPRPFRYRRGGGGRNGNRRAAGN